MSSFQPGGNVKEIATGVDSEDMVAGYCKAALGDGLSVFDRT